MKPTCLPPPSQTAPPASGRPGGDRTSPACRLPTLLARRPRSQAPSRPRPDSPGEGGKARFERLRRELPGPEEPPGPQLLQLHGPGQVVFDLREEAGGLGLQALPVGQQLVVDDLLLRRRRLHGRRCAASRPGPRRSARGAPWRHTGQRPRSEERAPAPPRPAPLTSGAAAEGGGSRPPAPRSGAAALPFAGWPGLLPRRKWAEGKRVRAGDALPLPPASAVAPGSGEGRGRRTTWREGRVQSSCSGSEFTCCGSAVFWVKVLPSKRGIQNRNIHLPAVAKSRTSGENRVLVFTPREFTVKQGWMSCWRWSDVAFDSGLCGCPRGLLEIKTLVIERSSAGPGPAVGPWVGDKACAGCLTTGQSNWQLFSPAVS